MKNDQSVGSLIHRIDHKLKASIDAQLKSHDLTFSQSQVLFLLEKNGSSMPQKQLQKILQVSHPTMVGLVQRLETNGYVCSSIDEKDRRSKIVTVTKKAEEFSHNMCEAREENRKQMVRGFSEEEIDELFRLLNKVYENIGSEKGKEII